MATETNWIVYNRAAKIEASEFLRIAKDLVWTHIYQKRQHGAGHPFQSRRALVLLCLLKVFHRMAYREVEALVIAHPDLQRLLELESPPGKSTIQRTHARLRESQLRAWNDRIVEEFKKSARTSA